MPSRAALGLIVVGSLVAGIVVGAVLILALAGPNALFRDEIPAGRTLSGSVEAPAGTPIEGLVVVASRGDRGSSDRGTTDVAGRFSIWVLGYEPVDLQVGRRDDSASPDLARRETYSVGDLEAVLRGVPASSAGIRLSLVRAATRALTVHVTGPEGGPVPRARVVLRSLADRVETTVGDDGRVRVENLAAREWRASAVAPDRPPSSLVRAMGTVSPQAREVELSMPRGVAMRVRLRPPTPKDVVLSVLGFERPWRPDADGSMGFLVSPDEDNLVVTADEYLERTPRSTISRRYAEGVVAVQDGATLALTPMH